MRAYKYRIYPSKKQEELLNHHLWLSKELWNQMLAEIKNRYDKEKKFPTKKELREMVKNKGLFSQVAQELVDRLLDGIKRKIVMKNKGQKTGFPRFKTFSRMKSIVYPQFGFSLEQKLDVTPFGEIAIRKHREIKGQIKTLTIKRELSGRWHAIFSIEEEKSESVQNRGPAVGIDLGLMNFATLSDKNMIKNPHHLKKWENKLAKLQRKLSKKQKRSKNKTKARLKVARLHEKIANIRRDFLHKTTNQLLSKYSLIALEDLKTKEMVMQGHGKNINDAAWNMFAHILCYKAESAGCRVVFVDPKNTTKACSNCGEITEKSLYERTHNCQNCGLSIDRDLNASINILTRATVGQTGSNACGDGRIIPS